MGIECNEPESLAFPLFVSHDDTTRDLSTFLKHRCHRVLVQRVAEVLHENILVLLLLVADLLKTLLLRHEFPDKHLLIVQHHAVHFRNRFLRRLFGFVVHEAVSSRLTFLISGNLARQNVSKSTEGIVQSLVVNVFVKIFDEDITDTRTPQCRVSLRPHNTAWTSLNRIVVHGVDGSFSISRLLKVNVGIPQRSSGDKITTDSDRQNGSSCTELLEEHSFSDIRTEISDVQRGDWIVWIWLGVHFVVVFLLLFS